MLSEDIQEYIKTTAQRISTETLRQLLSTLRYRAHLKQRHNETVPITGTPDRNKAFLPADFGKMTVLEEKEYSRCAANENSSKYKSSVPVKNTESPSPSNEDTPRITPEYVRNKYTKQAEELNALRKARKDAATVHSMLIR